MTSLLERVGLFAQVVVSIAVLGAFFGTIFLLLTKSIPIEGGIKEVLLVLVGVLAGSFKDVVGYYLGSSLGSAKKTDQITKGPQAG